MQLEVFPTRGGKWAWRRRTDGDAAQRPDGNEYDTRGEAVTAARAARESHESMVLLRQDGGVVGALLTSDVADGNGRRMNLSPAGESSEV